MLFAYDITSLLIVLYAPKLGKTGLDDRVVRTRLEVYRVEYHMEDASSLLTDMDDTIPYFPEMVCFGVFSIEVGKVTGAMFLAVVVVSFVQMVGISYATMRVGYFLLCKAHLQRVILAHIMHVHI